MKPNGLVIGVLIAALAGAVLLAVWLDDPLERPVVQELAGPRTPAPASAAASRSAGLTP